MLYLSYKLCYIRVYLLILLKSVIFLSYISSGIVLALLAFRLTTWLRVNRNMVGLLYSLAIATLAVNSFFAFIYLNMDIVIILLLSDQLEALPALSPPGCYSSTHIHHHFCYILYFDVDNYCVLTEELFIESRKNKVLDTGNYTIGLFSKPIPVYFLYTFSEFRISEPVLFGIIYNLIFSATKPVELFCLDLASGVFPRGFKIRQYRTTC